MMVDSVFAIDEVVIAGTFDADIMIAFEHEQLTVFIFAGEAARVVHWNCSVSDLILL